MFTVIIIMFIGMCLGYLVRKREVLIKRVDTIITITIVLLLFLLGVSIGTNETILNTIDTILFKVILITIGAVLGSVILSYFTYSLFFKKHEK